MWGGFLAKLDDIRVLGRRAAAGDRSARRTRSAAPPRTLSPRRREPACSRSAFAPGYEDHIRVVDGRLPEPAAILTDAGHRRRDVARIEIVLSAQSAADMEWPVGEIRSFGAARLTEPSSLLTGVFDPVDPGGRLLAARSFRPRARTSSTMATALAASPQPGSPTPPRCRLPRFISGVQRTVIWYPVDTALIRTETS